MMQAPLNNIIVTIDRKWIDGFTKIMRTAELNPTNKINPADLVNIVGTVVSVPRGIQVRRDYTGFSTKDIKAGDKLIFRYSVISTLVRQPESEEPIYKNEFFYKGYIYWKVDIQEAFAVIRDEKIIMLNGYVMVEKTNKANLIFVQATYKREIEAHTATVTHIGRNLTHLKDTGVLPIDTVFYKPGILQNYKINDKPFGILRQKDFYAKSDPVYENSEN
jgi:hypothetical protein